jgi:hypothetical protein
MFPVAVNVPVAGSYSSALAIPELKPPPAIKTLPSWSRVAVWRKRGVVMLPVAVNVPADCAIKEARVAVCPSRGVVMLPVAVNVPADWAMTIGARPPTPKKRSGSTKLALRDAPTLLPVDLANPVFIRAPS